MPVPKFDPDTRAALRPSRVNPPLPAAVRGARDVVAPHVWPEPEWSLSALVPTSAGLSIERPRFRGSVVLDRPSGTVLLADAAVEDAL